MSRNHPYKAYEKTPLWKAIEKAVDELVENGDITETTAREYIVGHLTKAVAGQQHEATSMRQIRRQVKRAYTASKTAFETLEQGTATK